MFVCVELREFGVEFLLLELRCLAPTCVVFRYLALLCLTFFGEDRSSGGSVGVQRRRIDGYLGLGASRWLRRACGWFRCFLEFLVFVRAVLCRCARALVYNVAVVAGAFAARSSLVFAIICRMDEEMKEKVDCST